MTLRLNEEKATFLMDFGQRFEKWRATYGHPNDPLFVCLAF